MKIGCCASVADCQAMKRIGYDFIELSARSVGNMSEGELKEARSILDKTGLPCIGFNNYCNDELSIVGPGFDAQAARGYAERISAKGALLGIKNIGIGAPLARVLPPNYDISTANRQMEEFLHITADAAQKYGIFILYESLNDKICNFGTDTLEALALVKKLNIPNLRLVLDFYHMLMMDEDLENIGGVIPYVQHLHISHKVQGTNRGHLEPSGMDFYRKSVKSALSFGYDGTLSVEAQSSDFETEARLSYKILKDIVTEISGNTE